MSEYESRTPLTVAVISAGSLMRPGPRHNPFSRTGLMLKQGSTPKGEVPDRAEVVGAPGGRISGYPHKHPPTIVRKKDRGCARGGLRPTRIGRGRSAIAVRLATAERSVRCPFGKRFGVTNALLEPHFPSGCKQSMGNSSQLQRESTCYRCSSFFRRSRRSRSNVRESM